MNNLSEKCSRCKSEKENVNQYCTNCLEYFRERYHKKQIAKKYKTQICNKCNTVKNLMGHFGLNKNGNYFKMCNNCRVIEQEKREIKKKKVLSNSNNQYCSNCSNEKPKSEFAIKNGKIMKTCNKCLIRKK